MRMTELHTQMDLEHDATERLNATPEQSNHSSSPVSFIFHDIGYYLSHKMLLSELVACLVIAALGHIAPEAIFRMSIYQRDIPYVRTQNGDVILDQYINRPKVESETVSDTVLILVAIVVPIVITLAVGYISKKHRMYEMHSSFCAILFALGSCMFLTNMIKLYCGYFRPNFYNLCEFDTDTMDCQGDDSNLSQSRKSFPSGHASTSFCGMTFLTLLFLGKVGLHNRSDSNGGKWNMSTLQTMKRRWLSVLVSTPMFIAIFIAVSRVHDDMHHPADVAFGSMIGFSTAYFAYGLWYSNLQSEYAGYSLLTRWELSRVMSDVVQSSHGSSSQRPLQIESTQT
jgi:diacylglycerol diphosphate phosphatase / phosphatidate phosphatase